MAKRVASSVSIHHVKLIKRGKKKKLLLRRVIDYLKSDTYMFAPLISSQSSDFYSTATAAASCSGVDASEPIWERSENLLEKVKDYMTSDQYLYAPLVAHQPLSRSAVGASSPLGKGPILGSGRMDASKWKESIKKLTEETRDPGQRRKSTRTEELNLGRFPYGRTTIIRHTQLQKETVKHVVQQNCHS